MAHVDTFPKFLKWYRSFNDQYPVDHFTRKYRSSIKQKLVASLVFCDKDNCDQAILENNYTTRTHFDPETGLGCEYCEKCVSHCRCPKCDSCDRVLHEDDKCNDCGKGNSSTCGCCECVFCDNCSSECSNDYCSECMRGVECCGCSCEKDTAPEGIEYFTQKPIFHAIKSRSELKINRSKRFMAAEIEVAKLTGNGSNITECVRKWGGCIVEDGSLPESGFEVNTSPAGGDHFVKQIEEICKSLNDAGADVNASCGLHIHLDARDFNFYDIRRLTYVYATVEDALFSMCSASRRESHYCLPCGEKYVTAIESGKLHYKKVRSDITKAIYGQYNTKGLRTEKYGSNRYNALNLHSILHRGSAEFRMFNGSVNAYKIISWAMVLASIMDWVNTHSDEDMMELRTKNPYDTLIDVCVHNPKLIAFINERISIHGTPEIKNYMNQKQSKAA